MISELLLCQAQLPYATLPPPIGRLWMLVCNEPATGIWRGRCEHGHIVDRVLCDEHRPDPGTAGCRACFDAGHECEMRAELVEALA